MTDGNTPKLKAYMVSAAFGVPPNQTLHANACIAPSPEAAVGIAVSLFCQINNAKEPLFAINCMELMEVFMADALGAIRGGEKPKVVSLREVEPSAQVAVPYQQVQRWNCICGAPENGAHTHQCQLANQHGNWPPPGAA